MNKIRIAILHYSAPPVIGGVEAVMLAHLTEFIQAGYSSAVIAGRGDVNALPVGADFVHIPEIDSQHLEVTSLNQDLENGRVPEGFMPFENRLVQILDPILREFDHLIVHNVFTKHFNLPLTGALIRLLDQGAIRNMIAWCHDFSWTSPSSRAMVYPGYPWDLLRIKRPDVTYVTVSKERQNSLASLYNCPVDEIRVIYNGVDPIKTLGISAEGAALIHKLEVFERDPIILMPVRVTEAKNIEFALEVVSALKLKGWKPLLVVTGPPDPHHPKSMQYYQSLRDLRSKLGVADCMRFVFESGSDPEQPFFIDETVVGDLFRIADIMFMPSHREGFGMPVVEAGLAGVPILSREVPAAQELAKTEAVIFASDETPNQVAERLEAMLGQSPTARLRRRVRRQYTWHAIFEDDIQPILTTGEEN